MKCKAKVDILSNYKDKKDRRVYALAGEELEIVSTYHSPVLLVKNKKGEIFPTLQNNLIDIK